MDEQRKLSEAHFINAVNGADSETQAMIEAFISWAFTKDVMLSDETLASEHISLLDFIHIVASEAARKDYMENIKATLHDKIITLPNHNRDNDNE